MLLTIYPVLLAAALFWGAQYSGRNTLSKDYLSLRQAGQIRSFACLGVILHHLTQQVTSYGVYYKGPVTLLNYAGILFTGVFFFFSGYGLLVGLYTKPDYLRSILTKRIPSVLIPFWCVNFLGILLNRFVYGLRGSLFSDFCDLTGITLVNSNGWFIIEIVILYLAFYLAFRLIRSRDAALLLLCLFTIALIVFSLLQGHDPPGDKSHWFRGEWWFNSTGTFIAGMLYARFREKAEALAQKCYPAAAAAVSLLFAAAFFAAKYAVIHLGYYHTYFTWTARQDEVITLLLQTSACILFMMTVLLMNMRIRLNSRPMLLISRISTELFLVHGYFVNRIFRNVRMPDVVRFAVVTACSILCAAVLSPVIRSIVSRAAGYLSIQIKPPVTLEREIAERKRKKRVRILKAAAAVTAVGIAAGFVVNRFIVEPGQYRAECGRIADASVGEEVLWGRFETDRIRPGKERLTWIVIEREGNRARLLAKNGIAGSWYHQKHEAVLWEDSDIRRLINSGAFLSMFNRFEIENVVPVDGDLISLLTAEEASRIWKTDGERELAITAAAENEGTNINRLSKDNNWDMKGYRSSWWWLKGTGDVPEVTAPIVTVDGEISESEKAVNKPNGAIRPVIWVEMSGNAVATRHIKY